MKPVNLLDRVIAWASPERGMKRAYARTMLASYPGAVSNRTSRSYEPSSSQTGVRVMTPADQRSLRDRARSLVRRNPLAAGVLDRATENIIGTGIQIEPTTSSPEFNEAAAAWWEQWKIRCDVTGRFHFDEMQRHAYSSYKRDGDFGTVLVDFFGVGKLQAIEGDYIESPAGKYLGGMMVDGVELNPVGGYSKFWIKSIDEKWKTTFTAVDARDFIFLANIDRISDVRGASNYRADFDNFDMIHAYLDSTVVASTAATMYGLLITKTGGLPAVGAGPTATDSAGDQRRILNMETGSVKYLRPGEEVKQIDAKHPTQQFPDAIAAFARFVGLKWGLPLEEVMLDYSRANYTVSRAIKMKIQRVADIEQQNFAEKYVSRVYRWALSKAIKNGEITVPVPEDNWKHEWLPQPLALTDPIKEIAAAAAAIELGIDARTYQARGYGYKFRDVVRQNAADRKLMAENGIPIDTGSPPPPPPPDAPPADENTPPQGQQGTAARKLLAMLPQHEKDNP